MVNGLSYYYKWLIWNSQSSSSILSQCSGKYYMKGKTWFKININVWKRILVNAKTRSRMSHASHTIRITYILQKNKYIHAFNRNDWTENKKCCYASRIHHSSNSLYLPSFVYWLHAYNTIYIRIFLSVPSLTVPLTRHKNNWAFTYYRQFGLGIQQIRTYVYIWFCTSTVSLDRHKVRFSWCVLGIFLIIFHSHIFNHKNIDMGFKK